MARAKNQELPGIEGEGVGKRKSPAVEKAADTYVKHRDARQASLKKEVEAKAVLVAAMKDANLLRYELEDDQVVELIVGKEKVKVSKIDADAE